jgi:peptide/nickel transport system ATP-binding protein
MAMLLITHDLGIVAAVCDRVAVMYKGEIVESGTTEQIYGDPQHDYTKALLGAVPRLDKPRTRRLQTLSGPSARMESETSGTVSQHGSAERRPSLRDGVLCRNGGRDSVEPCDAAVQDSLETALLLTDSVSVEFHSKPTAPWRKGDTVRAVDRVSLHVMRGEVLGLVGQSGSGKSTLVRAILGLVPVTSGKILFEGENITHADRPARRACWKRMQLVFQDPYGSLNGRLTIGQAVAQPLRQLGIVPRKECRREVARLLELVRIPPAWQNRFPHELSGGQRQRIAIARALAPRPELLFCDEPVSALDVSIQADVLNLLADLRETLGLTVLFISHDLAVVRHVADRVGVMHEGRIVDMLDADEIGKRCGHPYTQQLLDAVPIPDPTARRRAS